MSPQSLSDFPGSPRRLNERDGKPESERKAHAGSDTVLVHRGVTFTEGATFTLSTRFTLLILVPQLLLP